MNKHRQSPQVSCYFRVAAAKQVDISPKNLHNSKLSPVKSFFNVAKKHKRT